MVNVNEMDFDLWNEWDGNEWRNEWAGLWCINEQMNFGKWKEWDESDKANM